MHKSHGHECVGFEPALFRDLNLEFKIDQYKLFSLKILFKCHEK